MKHITITLISNNSSIAANVVTAIGEGIPNYALSVAKQAQELLTETESPEVILYALPANPSLTMITALAEQHPQISMILLLPPTFNQDTLMEFLCNGATDYAHLSDAGLLGLSRRLSDLNLQRTLLINEQRRQQKIELLREVSAIVGASLNPNDVLKNAINQLKRIVRYESVFIHLIENDQRRIIASDGIIDPNRFIGKLFPLKLLKSNPIAIIIDSHKPLVSHQIQREFADFTELANKQIQSWLGVPLLAREQVIGLITIHSPEASLYNQRDVETVSAFCQQVAIALENSRLHQIALDRIEHELTIAQEIQETLLPQVVPEIPGLQISGRILPARQVGGDFFHFFPVSGGSQLGVAVGDVSGKGIPAALYMAVAITAIDIQVRSDPPPGELMNRLNQALYNRLKENKMNIGLQVATFEPLVAPEGDPQDVDQEARGVLMTAASGGMIAPIGATERGCRFLPVSGLPIGALPAPDQTYQDDMFLLDPFTTIIFTSDGIVEAQNESGELFGFDRLEETINEISHTRDAETMADYIINVVQEFSGEAEQNDDMTVVVVVKT